MLRKISESLLVMILMVLVLGLYFRFVGPIPFSVYQTTTEKTQTFDVEGSGKVSVVPDEAVVSLGVRKQAQNVSQAQEQANSAIKQVTDELAKIEISEKNIQTENYYVSPDYNQADYRTVVGYTVSATLSIKVTEGQFEKIEKVIDLAGKLGLEQVSGLYFQLSDASKKKAMTEARKLAVDEAKQKAESMSSLAGIKLGKILNIREGLTSPSYPRFMATDMAISSVAESPSTKVNAGTSDVRVDITLSYETR